MLGYLSSTVHGISFYTWKGSAVPAGYKTERTERGVIICTDNCAKSCGRRLAAILIGESSVVFSVRVLAEASQQPIVQELQTP